MPGADTVMVFDAKTGVEMLMEGRLRAAGLMSGIVQLLESRATQEHSATRKRAHGLHGTQDLIDAIALSVDY
jgi:hypothetical protein